MLQEVIKLSKHLLRFKFVQAEYEALLICVISSWVK